MNIFNDPLKEIKESIAAIQKRLNYLESIPRDVDEDDHLVDSVVYTRLDEVEKSIGQIDGRLIEIENLRGHWQEGDTKVVEGIVGDKLLVYGLVFAGLVLGIIWAWKPWAMAKETSQGRFTTVSDGQGRAYIVNTRTGETKRIIGNRTIPLNQSTEAPSE